MGSRPSAVVGGGRGGGRLAGTYDLGTSLDDDHLFFPTIRSFKPFLGFRAISSSSSSELSTTRATTRLDV